MTFQKKKDSNRNIRSRTYCVAKLRWNETKLYFHGKSNCFDFAMGSTAVSLFFKIAWRYFSRLSTEERTDQDNVDKFRRFSIKAVMRDQSYSMCSCSQEIFLLPTQSKSDCLRNLTDNTTAVSNGSFPMVKSNLWLNYFRHVCKYITCSIGKEKAAIALFSLSNIFFVIASIKTQFALLKKKGLLFLSLFYNLSVCLKKKTNYYHFVGHCGAVCWLKWRIWRAKMYFSPLK